MWTIKKSFKAINWKSISQLMCPEAKADNLVHSLSDLNKAFQNSETCTHKEGNVETWIKKRTFIGDGNQSSSVFSVCFY